MAASKVFQSLRTNGNQFCTFYEVRRVIPDSQSEAVPIGKACPYCEPLVVDELGVEVAQGAEGELLSRAQASWRDTGICRKTRRRHFCQDTRNDGIVPAISFASSPTETISSLAGATA